MRCAAHQETLTTAASTARLSPHRSTDALEWGSSSVEVIVINRLRRSKLQSKKDQGHDHHDDDQRDDTGKLQYALLPRVRHVSPSSHLQGGGKGVSVGT